jgi:hypothetical protein
MRIVETEQYVRTGEITATDQDRRQVFVRLTCFICSLFTAQKVEHDSILKAAVKHFAWI